MSEKTYSEAIAELLTGKLVEIHTGDTRHTQNYSDFSILKKSVIRGYVRGANGDVLIVECLTDASGFKTTAWVNGFGITAITEFDGKNIRNIYVDEDHRNKGI